MLSSLLALCLSTGLPGVEDMELHNDILIVSSDDRAWMRTMLREHVDAPEAMRGVENGSIAILMLNDVKCEDNDGDVRKYNGASLNRER